MRTPIIASRNEQGSVLTMSLLTALIIGFALASYLSLVSGQNIANMRSLAWNSAIPVLESGIEEALTQLHFKGTNNLGENSWTYGTNTYGAGYQKTRYLGDSYYVTTIIPKSAPEIYSEGFVPTPFSGASGFAAIFAAYNPGAGAQSQYISRRVKVTTKKDAMFGKGIVAKGQIDLKGNNIATDSYDSSDPAKSIGGKYPTGDASKTKDNGDVATNSDVTDSLNIGNADIKGHVATGPGGSINILNNGSVGSKAWVDAGKPGVEPGYYTDDMNYDFKDVEVPFTSGYTTPVAGTVGGTNYNYVLNQGTGAGRFMLSMEPFTGNVLVSGNVVLYVTSSFSFSGSETITILPNSSLKVYVGCASASMSGNAAVNNVSGKPLSFQYYGLPSNTSISMSGNAALTGVIYAPEAALSISGGGKDTYDFVGASVTKTVTLNGHVNFHYDEDLAKSGPSSDYAVTTWNEY